MYEFIIIILVLLRILSLMFSTLKSWINYKKTRLKNHENELLKLSRNRAHHWYNAHASFWSSETDEKHCWRDVDEWTRSNYHYLAEEFSQDKKYTEEITQAASILWVQQT